MSRQSFSSASDSAPAVVGLTVGTCGVPIWGMSTEERFRRALQRAGGDLIHSPAQARAQGATAVVVFRLDHVLDDALIADLAKTPDVVVIGDDGRLPVAAHVPIDRAEEAERLLTDADPAALAGLRRATPAEVTSAYRNSLRKRSQPYALRLTPATLPDIEWRMFMGAYKGATDFVTKYCWPHLAVHVTRWCARRGIMPNTVTWVSLAFVLFTIWAFAHGWFLTGCLSAWIMTFLDTVDGKLARVTLTSSKLGEAFDHGIDHIHPPFWYWAWMVGLREAGMALPGEALILWIVIGGYLLGRAQEGFFLWRFGIEIHIWEPRDTWFRLVTARRNPNVAILMVFALAGRPDLGMQAVALWTICSLGFHFLRIYQASQAIRRGPIRSWLADPPRGSAT